nr:MAG TPA: hypothetical protein [Caudoviricetes sp.]
MAPANHAGAIIVFITTHKRDSDIIPHPRDAE